MALRNALEKVSTESTLAAIRDIFLKRASSNGDAHLISGNKIRYRREFTDATLAAFDVATGAGMTVAAGTGNLLVTTGTAANSTTTVTTKQDFTAPFKAVFGFKISQKIANQEFYVEAVAVNDSDGSLDETVVAAWRVAGSDSTATTNSRVEVRNGGTARTQSPNITTSTQTVDSVFEIVIESDEVQFHSRAADSTAGRTGSTTRNTVAPDPNRRYKLRIRIVNGATAPASSTTFTSSFVGCVDYTEIQTELTGGPGHANPGSSLPVAVTSGSVGVANATIAASASTIGSLVAKVLAAASTNPTLVKSSVARLYGYQFSNSSASWRYLRFYNQTTAPTVGTSVPAMVVPLAPGETIDANFTIPVSFATGLSYSITGGPADLDATVVGANEVVGHILYI